MTPKAFTEWATGYYGPWPIGMREDIRDYLNEKTDGFLDLLKEVCREKFPSRIGQVNGYPPDFSQLLEVASEVGRRSNVKETLARMVEYESKLLPAPEPDIGTAEMYSIDWAEVFGKLAKAKKYK